MVTIERGRGEEDMGMSQLLPLFETDTSKVGNSRNLKLYYANAPLSSALIKMFRSKA